MSLNSLSGVKLTLSDPHWQIILLYMTDIEAKLAGKCKQPGHTRAQLKQEFKAILPCNQFP